jgi:hypothetical protein
VRKPVSTGDIHMPFKYQTVSASHDAGIQAMNPNSVPANVDITLYLQKQGMSQRLLLRMLNWGKYAFDIAPGIVDFNGSVEVRADIPVVSQGFIRKKSSNVYSIAPPVER